MLPTVSLASQTSRDATAPAVAPRTTAGAVPPREGHRCHLCCQQVCCKWSRAPGPRRQYLRAVYVGDSEPDDVGCPPGRAINRSAGDLARAGSAAGRGGDRCGRAALQGSLPRPWPLRMGSVSRTRSVRRRRRAEWLRRGRHSGVGGASGGGFPSIPCGQYAHLGEGGEKVPVRAAVDRRVEVALVIALGSVDQHPGAMRADKQGPW